MDFIREGFQTLSSDWHRDKQTYRQTGTTFYTTPLRRWSQTTITES